MKIISYPRNIDQWRRATSHLSILEKGIYSELLDALYVHENKLPCDLRLLGRVIGVQTLGERKALAKVAQTYLERNGEFFSEKNVEECLLKIKDRSAKNSNSAKAKLNKINGVSSANAERTHSERCSERTASYKLIAKTNLASPSSVPEAAREAGLAGLDDEIHKEEVLPAGWCDYAESKHIPDEQIYKSWTKFKETSAFPWRLSRWKAWIDRERIKEVA